MKSTQIYRIILFVATGFLFLYFLSYHYRLGLTRYFDADEFAHLHWAAKMMEGKKPYIEFLTFFPPGYAVSLISALVPGWGTVQPFITARIMTFWIFAMMCVMSGMIFWEVRKSVWGAVLAAALLAFLPLPFDKYLEIRPDNLATLLLLAAIYFQIKKKHMVSGALYALSYLVLPKMVPNIAIGFGMAVLSRKLKPFIMGMTIPMAVFGIWVLTLGNFPLVFYSLFKLPVEANKISQTFIMMQDLFFYPNSIYYGVDGWNRGLLVNHSIWVLALLFSVYRLISAKSKSEVLISLQMWAQIIFFVQFAPLKHAQYLIPIGVFIAWYAADFVLYLSIRIPKIIFLPLFAVLALFLVSVFNEVTIPKQAWTNADFIKQVEEYYRDVPKDEQILDLTGVFLYNPDAYYACCIPFGQFAGYLSRPLPDLPRILEENRVPYIYQSGLKRVSTLPWAWQQYIYARYEPVDGDETLLKRL